MDKRIRKSARKFTEVGKTQLHAYTDDLRSTCVDSSTNLSSTTKSSQVGVQTKFTLSASKTRVDLRRLGSPFSQGSRYILAFTLTFQLHLCDVVQTTTLPQTAVSTRKSETLFPCSGVCIS